MNSGDVVVLGADEYHAIAVAFADLLFAEEMAAADSATAAVGVLTCAMEEARVDLQKMIAAMKDMQETLILAADPNVSLHPPRSILPCFLGRAPKTQIFHRRQMHCNRK